MDFGVKVNRKVFPLVFTWSQHVAFGVEPFVSGFDVFLMMGLCAEFRCTVLVRGAFFAVFLRGIFMQIFVLVFLPGVCVEFLFRI